MVICTSARVSVGLPCPACGGYWCDYDEAKKTYTGVRCDGGPKLWRRIWPPEIVGPPMPTHTDTTEG